MKYAIILLEQRMWELSQHKPYGWDDHQWEDTIEGLKMAIETLEKDLWV